MATETTITRDYIDNFAVKEYVNNGLIDEYFDDVDVSLRTVGMLGYTTELISNCNEDAFNTGSVLFRESFPNRAQIPESIYSHAAVFQLSNIFSTASSCKFLLVLEEEAIIKNMQDSYDKDTGIYHFYIDKNTTIYVEDIPFCLDYDIRMDIVKKQSDDKDDYLFTAKYIMNEYINSISELSEPYVKVRRSSDGFVALEVQTHQCIRDVRPETIITNCTINYPVIDINFEGQLAGFDILYKAPSDSSFTQMGKQIVYSQAVKTPFCYYQLVDEDTLRITFNTRDNFFMPEFNSDLEVILYITNGYDGRFDVYNGTDISLVPNNEKYAYANTYLTAAKPIGSSSDGKDQMDINALQELAVEGYRTANALTTEQDLQHYFSNYKYRYGDINILFIKKRDDVYERVYSAFIVARNGSFIYKTNSLNLKLNLSDMENPEKDVYMLEPGYLFTADSDDGYAEFYRDEEKYNSYYAEYLEAVENGDINYIDDNTDQADVPEYLNRPASYAEFKRRNGLDDKKKVFELTETDFFFLDKPQDEHFLLMNPFLIRFTKSPNLVSTYMTYINNASLVDFTNQNDDSYIQFILYTLHANRAFELDKKYDIYTTLAPSIALDQSLPVIKVDGSTEDGNVLYHLNDKYNLSDNDLRVIMMISDGVKNICFTELYPTNVDIDGNIQFSTNIFTDDHITSDSKLRLLDGKIFRNKETGDYYKVTDDETIYDKYNSKDEVIETGIPVDDVTKMIHDGILYEFNDIINMTPADDILIPMSDVTCKIYTLYNRKYDTKTSSLTLLNEDETDNIFYEYSTEYQGYMWTNEYSTSSSPITFIKPLDSVRTYLQFEDFTEASEDGDGNIVFAHDIMDVEMFSISMLRARTILNMEKFDYFMDLFYNNYLFLQNIIKTRLRNVTNIDVKFYNTYGRSKNFLIGENDEQLNTVNLSLSFDMWFVPGTDLVSVIPDIKDYIKTEVEQINSAGMNNLFISNLMRKIEIKFAYVDHIRFKTINKYDSTYQAVKNYVTDLDELTVEERRFYVPELLVCDVDDITINEYYVS